MTTVKALISIDIVEVEAGSVIKNKGGSGSKSADSRRKSPRIAIAPSSVAKVDAIAKLQNKSRADVLEELIDKEFRIVSTEEVLKIQEDVSPNNSSQTSRRPPPNLYSDWWWEEWRANCETSPK